MTTGVTGSFAWRESTVGRGLYASPLDALAPHVFTTRDLSFRGGDAQEHYHRLAEAFTVDRQPRSSPSHKFTAGRYSPCSPATPSDNSPKPTPLSRSNPARVIAVRVADCVPVLIADRQHRVVAAVHAGWRGTCVAVVPAAIEAMVDAGVRASDLTAALGPSIGPCCYQVDDRVRLAFLAMTPDAAAWFIEDGPGRWRLDLWQANRDQLEDAGVPGRADQHRASLHRRQSGSVLLVPEGRFGNRADDCGDTTT